MQQVIPPMFSRAQAEKRCFAMISCDMNGMKQINDSFGHHAGDEAICRMSGVFKTLEAEEMICIHISGDEFVAAGMVENADAADRLLHKLQEGIDALNSRKDWFCDIDASFGVFAGIPAPEDTMTQFMRMADRRMYEDKEFKKRK
jgi:diguanylate cyclase (GGDEF)-like protein